MLSFLKLSFLKNVYSSLRDRVIRIATGTFLGACGLSICILEQWKPAQNTWHFIFTPVFFGAVMFSPIIGFAMAILDEITGRGLIR